MGMMEGKVGMGGRSRKPEIRKLFYITNNGALPLPQPGRMELSDELRKNFMAYKSKMDRQEDKMLEDLEGGSSKRRKSNKRRRRKTIRRKPKYLRKKTKKKTLRKIYKNL